MSDWKWLQLGFGTILGLGAAGCPSQSPGTDYVNMTPTPYTFVRDEQGQDLVDYTLLLAFACFGTSVLFISIIGVFHA
jgi:Flp pilus assembly pilin Flp